MLGRRAALILLGSSIVGVSGCAGTGGPAVGLGQIRLQNHRTTAIDLRVVVDREQEQVHDETYALDGRDGQFVDGTSITEEWMGDHVRYHVTAEIVTEELNRSYSTNDAEEFIDDWGEHECFGLLFFVEDDLIDTALNPLESCSSER